MVHRTGCECETCSPQPEKSKHPEQIPMAGGKAASTKVPHLHLIPTLCLIEAAKRFELGIERKGDKAWNAISKNQEVLTDKAFIIERISHIMLHAAQLRDKIVNEDWAGLEQDDDASAIVWGGMFLQCVVDALQTEAFPQDLQ